METIGIRELKTHLSRHLKRVRAGVRLAVTERGRTIAMISPHETGSNTDWAHQMVAEGRAQWNGGKPDVGEKGVATKRGSAAAIVLTDRR